MKQAFTLVELIVVISIIAITSIVGISSFFGFIDEQELNSKIEAFKNDIKLLDRQIKNREIFDYKISLEKGKNTYLLDKNTFDIDKKIILQGDKIVLHPTGTNDTFFLKAYKGEKLFYSEDNLKEYDIGNTTKFIGFYNAKEINTLEIKKFEKKEDSLQIIEISPNPVVITNILGKKKFLDDSGTEIDTIEITFEKDGVEQTVKLEN